jgi:hypothetical protein
MPPIARLERRRLEKVRGVRSECKTGLTKLVMQFHASSSEFSL